MWSANSSAPSNLLLSDQQQTIDQQLAQIEARLRLLDEQQSSWEAHKASVQQTLDDRVAGLDALRVDLESQRLALEKERRQYEVRFAELQLRECELEERRRDLESNLAMAAVSTVAPVVPVSEAIASASEPPAAADETDTKPVPAAETVKTISPAKAAPVDLAAILRRTGYQIDQVDEEEQSNENVSLKEESSQSVPAEKPSLDITAPIPRNRMPAEPSEEVSIDEYMSHLLARSRGDSVPLPAPTASVSRTRSRPPVLRPGRPRPRCARTAAPISQAGRAAGDGSPCRCAGTAGRPESDASIGQPFGRHGLAQAREQAAFR